MSAKRCTCCVQFIVLLQHATFCRSYKNLVNAVSTQEHSWEIKGTWFHMSQQPNYTIYMLPATLSCGIINKFIHSKTPFGCENLDILPKKQDFFFQWMCTFLFKLFVQASNLNGYYIFQIHFSSSLFLQHAVGGRMPKRCFNRTHPIWQPEVSA